MEEFFNYMDSWLIGLGVVAPIIIALIFVFAGKAVLSSFLTVSITPEDFDNTLIIGNDFLVQSRTLPNVYKVVDFDHKNQTLDVVFVSNSGLPKVSELELLPQTDLDAAKTYTDMPISSFVPFDVRRLIEHFEQKK